MRCKATASNRAGEPGFTLIEVVLVIAISGVLAGVLTSFITRPMEGYRDLTLRAALVDESEGAVRRTARDVRAALPNSLRVSGDRLKVEMLRAVDGARYRAGPGTNPGTGVNHSAATDRLSFTGDSQFNVLGRFPNLSFTYGTALPAGHRVAIYSAGSWIWTDAAADANPGVISPSATSITLANDTDEDQIQLGSAFTFRFTSPRQRLYLTDGPLSYVCDLGAGTLTRYDGYAIVAGQPTDPAVAPLSGASSALVSRDVTVCDFGYDPGTPTRAGLLTIALSVSRGGEQVQLLHQVHVDNTP